MRLFSLTVIIVIIACILVILLPAQFIQISSAFLPATQEQQVGGILAGISFFIGRPASSAAVYDYLIFQNPDSSDLYRLQSESLLAADDIQGALSSLEMGIARDPTNPVLLKEKAKILIINGKIPQAEMILDQITALKTDNPDYLSIIADTSLEKARYLEAFELYSRLLSLRPDDGLVQEKRSDVIFALLTIPTAGVDASPSLKSQNLYYEGIMGYQRALQLRPDRSEIINTKMKKRSDEYTPKSIEELESRYQQFRYLQPGDDRP